MERWEHIGIAACVEYVSERNNAVKEINANDETRKNILEKLVDLSVPGTNFGRQSCTHHMMIGQIAKTNQILEFLIGRILTPDDPPSHQQQNISTQVSQDDILPVVEQPPHQNSGSCSNNSISCLAEAIAAIAFRQRLQAATMLKPVSINTLIFDGRNEKFELFEDLFHTMFEMQPQMREAMKIDHFHAHLRKEALQSFRNISAPHRKSLEDVVIVFR